MAAPSKKRVESGNVLSFVEENVEKKARRRKQPFVKVSYDSGSDADAESGDDIDQIKAKKVKLSKRKRKPSASEDDSPASSDEAEVEEESNIEESNIDESDDDDAETEQVEPGAGWADAMAKILRNETPADDDEIVLSKSKEYAKRKAEDEEHIMEIQKERRERKHWENLYRVKPKVTEREHERGLQRTATRGVVQLFNAVKKQQKFLEDKLKDAGSETKRIEIEASVSKGDFLDLLKGSNKEKKSRKESRNMSHKKKPQTEEPEKPMWSVLREDFMMGAKMKDWDKEHNNENSKPKAKDARR